MDITVFVIELIQKFLRILFFEKIKQTYSIFQFKDKFHSKLNIYFFTQIEKKLFLLNCFYYLGPYFLSF